MKKLLVGLMTLKKVNSQFKHLNDKHDQCKDMFRGVLLLKNKSRKSSRKQNKRKQQRETENFTLLHQFSALASLSVRHAGEVADKNGKERPLV